MVVSHNGSREKWKRTHCCTAVEVRKDTEALLFTHNFEVHPHDHLIERGLCESNDEQPQARSARPRCGNFPVRVPNKSA